MLRMSFVIPSKPGEKRRAILPEDLARVRHHKNIYIETGYGGSLGIPDEAYAEVSGGIVSRFDAHRFPIVCDIKGPLPEAQRLYEGNQTIFGWLHADENPELARFLVDMEITGIEWAHMFEPDNSGPKKSLTHTFRKNNYIAGRAGVRHALQIASSIPAPKKAAILGLGNVGQGAFDELVTLGFDKDSIDVYRSADIESFSSRVESYSVVVDAMLWNPAAPLYKQDEHLLLMWMQPGSVLVNIGWGVFRNAPITNFDNPMIDAYGVQYYGIDHTPCFLFRDSSAEVSRVLPPHIDALIEGQHNSSPVLKQAMVTYKGMVVDPALNSINQPVFAC